MRLLGVLLLLLCGAASAHERAMPEDELRRARNEFSYGNYEAAAQQLRALLYPMRLSGDAQVIEGRKTLALCYALLDRASEAREEFARLLYLEPDYELDPFSVAPAIVEQFEAVRSTMKDELDPIRRRKTAEKLGTPQQGILRVVEQRVVEREALIAFMPFGIGQINNGDLRWAAFFGISEIALLAVNVGTYLGSLSMQHFGAEQRGAIQALAVAQYTSLALFGTMWSVGAVHARLNFEAVTRLPPEVHESPLQASALGMGLTLQGSL